MAKSKIKIGPAAIKEFFTQHVEKVVLGVVLAVVGLFVYLGWQVEQFPAQTRQESLRTQITQARATVDNSDVNKISEALQPRSIRDDAIVISVKPDPWQPSMPLDLPIRPSRSKRRDPVLYPPTDLKAVATVAAIATRPTSRDDFYSLDEKWREMQEQGNVPAVEDPRRKKKGRTTGERSGLEGLPVSPYGSYGSSEARGLTDEERMQLQSYRPSSEAIPKSRNIVSVVSLVPYKKQLEEYEDALSGNAAYVPERDSPNYIFFNVERADVTADPTADPDTLKWVPLSTKQAVQLQFQKGEEWESVPEELVDPAYVLPGMTLPVPPALMTDLKKLAGHPEIPWANTRDDGRGAADTQQPSDATEEEGAEGPEGPETPDMFVPGAGESRQPGGRSGYPTRPTPAYEGGRGGYSGYPGYGYSEGGASYDPRTVSYKLFRFIDLNVERGRKYRYRVRLTLEDPNHPTEEAFDPPPTSLDRDVEERLRQLAAEEAKTGKRRFYRMTDWSEPTPIVEVPEPIKLVNVEVTPGVESPASGTNIRVPSRQPSGKLMVVQWDDLYAVHVAGTQQVERGSVANFVEKGEALHPMRLEFIELDRYNFDTGAMVVDFRGGDKLPGGDFKNPLYAPSEIALVDRHGNFIVQDEAEGQDVYLLYARLEPKKDPSGMDSELSSPGGFGDLLIPRQPKSSTRRSRE